MRRFEVMRRGFLGARVLAFPWRFGGTFSAELPRAVVVSFHKREMCDLNFLLRAGLANFNSATVGAYLGCGNYYLRGRVKVNLEKEFLFFAWRGR